MAWRTTLLEYSRSGHTWWGTWYCTSWNVNQRLAYSCPSEVKAIRQGTPPHCQLWRQSCWVKATSHYISQASTHLHQCQTCIWRNTTIRSRTSITDYIMSLKVVCIALGLFLWVVFQSDVALKCFILGAFVCWMNIYNWGVNFKT